MKLDDEVLRQRLDPLSEEWRTEAGLRDSAVLLPLVERQGTDWVVFNRRRDDLPWHPGQVCFPGGARDLEETAVECAVRETCEEMGLHPGAIRVLGRLPDRISIAGFRVAAFVGRLEPLNAWRVREAEVAEAFEVPCAHLLEPARWTFKPTRHEAARFARIPYFASDVHVVWGLTGIVLRDFVRAAAGFDPPDPEAAP